MGSSQLNGWPHILKLGLYHFVYKRNWVWAGDIRRDTEFEKQQFLFSHFWGFLWTMIIKLKDWYQTPKSNFDTHGMAQLLAPMFLNFEKVDFSQNHVLRPLRRSKNGQKFYISKFQKDDSKMFFGLFSNYWVAFWGNPLFNFAFLALFKKWAKSK